MADNNFSTGRAAANSEDTAAALRDQLLARALAQQLMGSSDPSSLAAPRMEQSSVNLMQQLRNMQMQQSNPLLSRHSHLIQPDEKFRSKEGIEPNVSRLLNSLQGYETSVLPESRPGILQQLHQLEKGIQTVLQRQEPQTKSDCAVSSSQARDQHPQHQKLDKVVTKAKASEKDSNPVIAPCPARGMPIDHNYKTAKFVIPNSIKHGDELICSYPACRNAGIKFLYCSQCKVPVAKRNFLKSHQHSCDGRTTEVSESESGKQKNKYKATFVPAHPKVLGKSSSSKKPRSRKRKAEKAPVVRSKDEANENDRMIKRTKVWVSLLYKRPQTRDKAGLAKWLKEVLSVSDKDKPLSDLTIN